MTSVPQQESCNTTLGLCGRVLCEPVGASFCDGSGFFHCQVSLNVFFGKPGPWFEDCELDGDKNSIFHDIDGSVTGYKDAYVGRMDNYLIRHPDCVNVTKWNAVICSGTYAQVGWAGGPGPKLPAVLSLGGGWSQQGDLGDGRVPSTVVIEEGRKASSHGRERKNVLLKSPRNHLNQRSKPAVQVRCFVIQAR